MADEEVITTTAAERRLGGALMWTGALLGAMFIAVLGLGFMLYNTAYSETGPVKTLTAENKDLRAKLDTATTTLNAAQQELKDTKKAKDDLQTEYDKIAKKKPGAPKPAPVNPF
jgi:hypothetical protein